VSVADLKASLVNIENTLVLAAEAMGFSMSIAFAVGGATCLILGGILFITLAAPIGIPLVIAGGLAVVASQGPLLGKELFCFVTINYLGNSVQEGYEKSKALVQGHTNSLEASMVSTL